MNLLYRQPSHLQTDSKRDSKLSRSHTVTEGILTRRRQENKQLTSSLGDNQQRMSTSLSTERVKGQTDITSCSEGTVGVRGQSSESEPAEEKGVEPSDREGGAGAREPEQRVNPKVEDIVVVVSEWAEPPLGKDLILSRVGSVSEEIRWSPGFLFLTRPDLYKFAKVIENLAIGLHLIMSFIQEQKSEEFFSNLPVLQLIQTIRSDHSLYPRYQHSSKLVKVINSFARTDCKLPEGWEKKVEPKTKKVCI